MADIIEQSDMLLKDFNSSGYISKYVMEVLPQLVAEIKRLQAQVENCHAAKNLHARRSEKLQEQLVAKDDLLTQNQLTIQMHHSNVLELQKELDRWQKIAIEATAKHNLINALDAREREYLTWENSNPDTKQSFMETAAKELGLQVKQEAGYLERLENEYLHLKSFVLWDRQGKPLPWCIAYDGEEEQAQAALEKIRKG